MQFLERIQNLKNTEWNKLWGLADFCYYFYGFNLFLNFVFWFEQKRLIENH